MSLFVDGKKDGEGRVDMTVPMLFSADETCDLGKETGSTVSPDYGPENNAFTGEVHWVQIDLEKDDSRPPDQSRRALPDCDGAAIVHFERK
ncbi:MAG TPA: hypothetical protein VEX68_14655 [Bryobacteraceae bacterium]|nr:hypothetical protein [Bryobacteraceae bacterium]